ncbi:SDR family NAD(P)-dependent oxidoreductase [Mycetocola reblochoni]|uniref:SDR family NAD(P)-dependent oxidoreductase n=1 Tax=Mycetocola reblochoni TaxID=331618 RepID=UPI003F9A09C1
MTSSSKNIAVVLAGGVGERVGLGIPKQLIRIAGKPIMVHTLETINDHPRIDEVIVMMHEDSIPELEKVIDRDRLHKLSRTLPGGATRNDTTLRALDAVGADDTKVLFHDAVRPFIDDRIIDDCIDALDDYSAVDTAIVSADTIIRVDADDCIDQMPARAVLRRGQTPQAFRAGTIRAAYAKAAEDPDFAATDDCGVVFNYLPGTPIKVVEGSSENMKVTEAIDIAFADKIFQMRKKGVDADTVDLADLAGKRVVVFGGSYGIGLSIAEGFAENGSVVKTFSRSATGTDVRSRKSIRKAVDAAVAELGGIDIVVITAGVLTIAPLTTIKKRDMVKTINTNLLAPAIIAREVYPHLEASHGDLVLFTSSSYTRGRAGYSLYSATKAGVVNLTQALSEEWADSGVSVNCINPQRTATPMRTAAFGDEPADTLLTPEKVAEATARTVLSELTGQVVDVTVR